MLVTEYMPTITPSSSNEQQFLDVTWNDFNVTILSLALKIKKSGWHPDSIVCIGRGGMSVGDALSRVFQRTLGVHMCSSYTGEGEMQQDKLKIAEHLSITVKELKGKVLLVDDLVDSGKTLLSLRDRMLKDNPNITEIKTAVVYRKTCTEFPPDFHGETVNEKVWIFLPNEIFDQMQLKNLSKEHLEKLSEDQIKELAVRMFNSLPDSPLQKLPEGIFDRLAIDLINS